MATGCAGIPTFHASGRRNSCGTAGQANFGEFPNSPYGGLLCPVRYDWVTANGAEALTFGNQADLPGRGSRG
jgi:hypothetical protein